MNFEHEKSEILEWAGMGWNGLAVYYTSPGMGWRSTSSFLISDHIGPRCQ